MLIDFRKPILDFNGDPIKGPDGKDFLLVNACHTVLQATFPDEQNLSATDKISRFALGLKIAGPIPVDLSNKEIAEIQKLIAKFYGPLILGRVDEILEGKSELKAVAE